MHTQTQTLHNKVG